MPTEKRPTGSREPLFREDQRELTPPVGTVTTIEMAEFRAKRAEDAAERACTSIDSLEVKLDAAVEHDVQQHQEIKEAVSDGLDKLDSKLDRLDEKVDRKVDAISQQLLKIATESAATTANVAGLTIAINEQTKIATAERITDIQIRATEHQVNVEDQADVKKTRRGIIGKVIGGIFGGGALMEIMHRFF